MVTTTPASSRKAWSHRWLWAPFTADTWRRTSYALLALPVGLVSVPLALVGCPAGRLQRRLARRLLRLEVAEPVRTGSRALLHAVLAAPLNLVAMVVTGYGWNPRQSRGRTQIPGVGWVENWYEVTAVSDGLVSFQGTIVFESDGEMLTSDSTLRFRTRDEVTQSLVRTGFTLGEVREAPDRPGREMVFLARRP
jgi:hypothetical protein